MNKDVSMIGLAQKVEKFAKPLGGVFTFANLSNLVGRGDSIKNRRVIDRLVKEEVVYPIRKRNRIYITKDPDLWTLASRLKPECYITADAVLAKNLLIGTVPGTISAVYKGREKKLIETPFGNIRFFSASENLMFGFTKIKNGVQVADSEKAYLDLLYFYQKGGRFVADPFQDIKTWNLDKKKIRKYLKAYKNPRFIKFVKNRLAENV